MRALKTLLIILLAVVALAVVLGLSGPKHSEVSRSTVVRAPVSAVYAHVNSLQRMGDWSPWNKRDPAIKISYSGPDGVVGQTSSWSGNDQVGAGEQEITALEPGKKVGVALRFKEPFESAATADLTMEPMGDSTKVTWTFGSENNFISRIFLAFSDMDKMVGPDFAEGLASLKSMAEADAKAMSATKAGYGGFAMDLVDRPEVVYAGHRAVVPWEGLDAFFNKEFNGAEAAMGKAGIKVGGPATALYYSWDETSKKADLHAGFPVEAVKATELKGMDIVSVPAGKAWMIRYQGNPANTMNAHLSMDSLFKARSMEAATPVVEEYLFNPEQDHDTAQWVTNILYYVK
jgi:effector-binding domain-containing protein